MFNKAKLIWLKEDKFEVNEYANFKTTFDVKNNKNVILKICCVSEFVVFVNDKEVGFGQYANFVDDKFVNEYDLSSFVKQGSNTIYIVALSKNYNSSSHIADGKGIIFEITSNDEVVCYSDEHVYSRLDNNYVSGPLYNITGQLGMSYSYNFVSNNYPFEPSRIIERKINYLNRPIKKMDTSNKVEFSNIKENLFGYEKEIVGYLYFDIDSDIEQDITLAYGEHIVDGNVRQFIGPRNFSVTFKLKKGSNIFKSYFLRFGLRYLNITTFKGKVNHIGVYQALYPHKVVKRDFGELNVMVDKSLYTLDCCMHEHYEDCPWREQAQYTFDSRIVMMIDYMAFDEFEFPKACLKQMSWILNDKGVLPITSPNAGSLSIPEFCLVYPMMVKEYYLYSNDKSLLQDVYPNLNKMMNHYIDNLIDGLLPHLDEWNFYEWEDGLANDHEIGRQELIKEQFDLPLNAFMVMALESFAYVCNTLSLPYEQYLSLAENIKKKAHDMFYKENIFYTYCKQGKLCHLAEYSNYLALYSGIANKQEKQEILKVLLKENSNLVPLTLSTRIFKYDLLLYEGNYKEYIIEDIKKIWGIMDKNGATTYWETIKGDADFDNAGSLCHGWSSIPAYVLYKMDKMGQ